MMNRKRIACRSDSRCSSSSRRSAAGSGAAPACSDRYGGQQRSGRDGLVASLARPGGNVTGLTTDTGPELEAKRLELLKEGLPRVSRVAYVGTKADWASERGLSTRAATRALALNVFLAEHGPNDYTGAFRVISREHADALITSNSPHHFAHRRLIAEFALKNRLASMSRYSGSRPLDNPLAAL